MAAIKISAFAGERPLITPRLLPETAAKSAFNARLDDGALTPINKAVLQSGVAGAGHRTIYLHDGNWYSWAGDINAAPGPVAQERLYFTGDGVPKMRVAGVDYPLAVPNPTGTPVATVGGTGTGDTISRTYAWTWVTSFGEESAPSKASAIVDWKPGQTVTVSGFAAAPAGRAITKQRIYRSQTGSSGTYLYFIAERAASNANFSDTVAVDGFNEALPSAAWNPPPDGLSGLIAMPNGMMAAFVGHDVYFCEPYRPHAWPETYIMTCESNVVALGAIGTSLVVMTEGKPYIMSGSTPDSMQSLRLEAIFPCINARAVVDLGFAICYPSRMGLVSVKADGSIALATEQLFRRDEWLALDPATALGAQLGGVYMMFYDTTNADGDRVFGTIFININSTPFLVRSAEYASAVFYSVQDEALYFTRDGDIKIYEFDSHDGAPETYYWRSKEFWVTAPVNFGVILIDIGDPDGARANAAIEAEAARIAAANAAIFASGAMLSDFNDTEFNVVEINGDALAPIPGYLGMTVGIYADGKLVRTITKDSVPQRLPAKIKARKWEVDVSSSLQITQIIFAGTMDELRNVQ